MKKFDKPKQSYRTHADEIEDARIRSLDQFESEQVDVFLNAIGDELAMDGSAALSFIHYAASNGLQDWFCEEWEGGQIKWLTTRHIFSPGWTPIELAQWLANYYKQLYRITLDDIKWMRPERYEKISSRNAINFLANMLFYNDSANRFEGSIA